MIDPKDVAMLGPKDLIIWNMLKLMAVSGVRDQNSQPDPVFGQYGIEVARAIYECDGNPLEAWWAYWQARESGQPAPEWVMTYFDRCAVALLNLARDSKHGKNVTTPSAAIAEAFEMKRPGQGGRGSVFSEFTNRKWLSYAFLVVHSMHKGNHETCAIENAARKTGVSVATVRRAYQKFKAFTKSPIL